MLGKLHDSPISLWYILPKANLLLFYSPGRFFVAHEFKILLAYMLANYDIKLIPAEERPKPSYIGQTIVPPLGATVQVRRRKGTENAARTT